MDADGCPALNLGLAIILLRKKNTKIHFRNKVEEYLL